MSVSTTPAKDDVLVNHEHDFRAAGDRMIIWRPYFAQYFPIQVVRYSC